MKKIRFTLTAAIMAALFGGALTSCSDDDPEDQPEVVETLSGIYTVNSGNQRSKIAGSMTSYNYTDGTVTDAMTDAFMQANGIALGDTPQQALVYGSKMYIAVYESNVIWVTDPHTLKLIDKIIPTGDATSPRALTAHDGKIYASMYTGYVCSIDTTSLAIDKTVKVGPNPEELAVANNKLYVANSDGQNYLNNYADCSISILDLPAMTEHKIKDITKVFNPTKMVSNGTEVFTVCMGDYGDIPATVKKINGDNVQDICPGTLMAINGNELFVINAPYGAPEVTYQVYSTTTGSKIRDMVSETVESPSTIAVDPVTGDIVILSYTLSDAGYAQYAEPCYGKIYQANGAFRTRFTCGVGAISLTFVHQPAILKN